MSSPRSRITCAALVAAASLASTAPATFAAADAGDPRGVVQIGTGLGKLFGPCPTSAAVYLNGRYAGSIRTTVSQSQECGARGDVLAPIGAEPGSYVFYTVTGNRLFPAFGLGMVRDPSELR